MNSLQFKDKQGNKKYINPYWPIGSIYLSVSSANPTKCFGGTWQQIAKGRTLVGVDSTQTEFNTVKKTGGEKTHKLIISELPKFKPEANNGATTFDNSGRGHDAAQTDGNRSYNYLDIKEIGGDQPHNNLQPYFTCYIWLRTA